MGESENQVSPGVCSLVVGAPVPKRHHVAPCIIVHPQAIAIPMLFQVRRTGCYTTTLCLPTYRKHFFWRDHFLRQR